MSINIAGYSNVDNLIQLLAPSSAEGGGRLVEQSVSLFGLVGNTGWVGRHRLPDELLVDFEMRPDYNNSKWP